jgi:hypothetical protein
MSLGALLLAAGANGKRLALPNAKILIHQLSGEFEGQASDIEIQAREAIALKRRMEEIISQHTGQPPEQISTEMERDYFMTAEEAQGDGLIDTVIGCRSGFSDGWPQIEQVAKAWRTSQTTRRPRSHCEPIRPARVARQRTDPKDRWRKHRPDPFGHSRGNPGGGRDSGGKRLSRRGRA